MKKFKYQMPEKVRNIFLNAEITELVFEGRKYEKDICWSVHQLGIIEEYVIGEMIIKYPLLKVEDFKEVITVEDTFKKKMIEMLDEIQIFQDNTFNVIDTNTMITVSSAGYKNDFNFIIDNHGNYFIVTDNAASGINQSLKNYLSNKKSFISNFTFYIRKVNIYITFEDVFKWYYFQEDFENSAGAGAGTLTGWLTEKDAILRAHGKKLVKLNRNFRLKKHK